MLEEHDSAEIVRFRATRAFLSHGNEGEAEGKEEEARWFEASVELANSHITLVLERAEYDFAAQQCGELADGLSSSLWLVGHGDCTGLASATLVEASP
jgi:hypothetical protein